MSSVRDTLALPGWMISMANCRRLSSGFLMKWLLRMVISYPQQQKGKRKRRDKHRTNHLVSAERNMSRHCSHVPTNPTPPNKAADTCPTTAAALLGGSAHHPSAHHTPREMRPPPAARRHHSMKQQLSHPQAHTCTWPPLRNHRLRAPTYGHGGWMGGFLGGGSIKRHETAGLAKHTAKTRGRQPGDTTQQFGPPPCPWP